MKNINNGRGISILGVLFLGFILLMILSYFRVSVKDVVESPTGQENIEYVKGETKGFWDKYLAEPAHYLWHDIWIELFWKSFVSNLERIRDGEPTDFDKAVDKIRIPAPPSN